MAPSFLLCIVKLIGQLELNVSLPTNYPYFPINTAFFPTNIANFPTTSPYPQTIPITVWDIFTK